MIVTPVDVLSSWLDACFRISPSINGITVNLRRLKYFVKIVDVGSLTQASEVLHVAQPALSQQLATLEGEFNQQLLIRTPKGVLPTEAGKALYRHAQVILRQFEQARADVINAGRSLSGLVSVGLAPGTAASALALPLLQTVHERHPQIILHINENLGTALREVVRNGQMDMAVLYGGDHAVQGLAFEALLTEDLCVVSAGSLLPNAREVAFDELRAVDLLLPCMSNQLRRYVDRAFSSAGVVPRVVAEMESSSTLSAAVVSGVGATILPVSIARTVAASAPSINVSRLVSPRIEVPLALCTSENLSPSEPAQVVKQILLELAGELEMDRGLHGLK